MKTQKPRYKAPGKHHREGISITELAEMFPTEDRKCDRSVTFDVIGSNNHITIINPVLNVALFDDEDE